MPPNPKNRPFKGQNITQRIHQSAAEREKKTHKIFDINQKSKPEL
jgi:hypothetical protein